LFCRGHTIKTAAAVDYSHLYTSCYTDIQLIDQRHNHGVT